MKVRIKDFGIPLEVKTKGIEFEVHTSDGKTHRGDLVLTKSSLIWCQGKTSKENGQKLSWDKFIKMMENNS